MKKIINKIQKLVLIKKLKEQTNIPGNYEIERDVIICSVNSEELKAQTIRPYGYNLIFTDIKSNNQKNAKQIAKPINYIIENTFFDQKINFLISTPFCSITFKKCVFKEGIFIDGKNVNFIDCSFEACEYSKDDVVPNNHFHIMTIGNDVENIKFINNILKVTNVTNPVIHIWIKAKNIALINTNLINLSSLELTCETLMLNNSSITTKKTNISAESIEEHNSVVITVKEVSEESAPANEEITCNMLNEQSEGMEYDSSKNAFVKRLIKVKEGKNEKENI